MYIIGDTHGSLKSILDWNSKVENSNLVHVGDLCLGLYNLESLAVKLKKRSNKLFCVRGNHESTEYRFEGQVILDSITLVEDYSTYLIEGKKVLFVGGAISLDRKWRREFKAKYPSKENWYHEDEAFKYVKYNYNKIDILITHTAHPSFITQAIPGFLEKFAEHDDKLIEDIELERKNLLLLYDDCIKAGVEKMYFGHWHFSESGNYKGIDYRGLAIDEIIQA